MPAFEKFEFPLSLGSRKRALRAERFKLKSEFGHFLTYITWSKISHVLLMFETLLWFSSDLGLKSQVIPMVLKALHFLSTAYCSDPILDHAPPVSLCFNNTGPWNVSNLEDFARAVPSNWNQLGWAALDHTRHFFRFWLNVILLKMLSLMASSSPRLGLVSHLMHSQHPLI